MGLAIWQAENVWVLVVVLLEKLLPALVLTGWALALVVAIFMIIFFAFVFLTVYGAAEGGPRCRDDISGTGGE